MLKCLKVFGCCFILAALFAPSAQAIDFAVDPGVVGETVIPMQFTLDAPASVVDITFTGMKSLDGAGPTAFSVQLGGLPVVSFTGYLSDALGAEIDGTAFAGATDTGVVEVAAASVTWFEIHFDGNFRGEDDYTIVFSEAGPLERPIVSLTAATAPLLEVSSSSNPIVGGLVQLQPGDQNVSITLAIIPDANGVKQFAANFTTETSSILVDSCAAGVAGTMANCLSGGLGNTNWDFQADDFSPAMLAPFTVGTVVLSLTNPTIGTIIQVRGDIPSFIADGNFDETDIKFQDIAVVVPEPGMALSMIAALATLGGVSRWRRNGSEGTA
jgi:hypothetical protein